MTPGGRLLSPSRSSRRLLEGHALLPCLPERWRASGVTRLLPPGGLHHFASDHQLAGVSHPHPAPAQGPSPGILASLSLSNGDREAPFVPSPEDREQAGFMAAGLVHRAGVGGEVLRGSRGLVPFSWAHVWGSSALTQTGGGDVARRRTPWVICGHQVDAGEDPQGSRLHPPPWPRASPHPGLLKAPSLPAACLSSGSPSPRGPLCQAVHIPEPAFRAWGGSPCWTLSPQGQSGRPWASIASQRGGLLGHPP